MKNKLFIFSIVSVLTMLNACSTTNDSSSIFDNSSDENSSTAVSSSVDDSSSEEENNDKRIDDGLFKNPSLEYRPMVMMHNSTTKLVDDVYERGYGGIVTNVTWDKSYLNSPLAFSRLSSVLDHAINDLGMYAYIYDEYGYPSGTAYGQTLKGNPEYEALGLVVQYLPIKAKESGTINLLYGHKAIETAYVYDGNSKDTMILSSGEDVSSLINDKKDSITYTNRTSTNKVLVAYMSKYSFNGKLVCSTKIHKYARKRTNRKVY